MIAGLPDAVVRWVGGAIALVLLALCLRRLHGWLTGETRGSAWDWISGLLDLFF